MKGKGKGKSNSPAQNANRAKAATTPSPPFIPRAKCSTMFHNTSDNSATTKKTTNFDEKMKDMLPSNICAGHTTLISIYRNRMVPTNKEVFLCGLWPCGESRSQQGILKFKKKIGGNHAFFRDNQATIIPKNIKYKAMYGIFFPNWSFVISEKCMVSPYSLFEYQEHLLSSAFSTVLNRAKISPY